MIGRLLLLIICQVFLLALVLQEALKREDFVEAWLEYPRDMFLVLARFLCAMFLHVSMADEAKQGFNMMKYAMNHMWKFKSWKTAFMIGFVQMCILILLEAVNLIILMTNDTVIGLIMNFLALVIISQFDDYFFVRREPVGELIANGKLKIEGNKRYLSKILKIETTSSDFADHLVEGNQTHTEGIWKGSKKLGVNDQDKGHYDENTPLFYIHVDFWRRPLINKLARSIYAIFKSIYSVIWFYFIPFSILYYSYMIPYTYR